MTPTPNAALSREALDRLADRFALPGAALALIGSHARGEAGPDSDVDLLLLVPDGAAEPAAGPQLVDGRLVVVSTASETTSATWFELPELVVKHVGGLRRLQVVRDPEGKLAAMRTRALDFRWTPELDRRADRWVGASLAGWVEEALRGLGGRQRDDLGRMLLARFGLSWGLSRLMLVHERLLPVSERAMLTALAEALGEGARWVALQRAAFGLPSAGLTPSLPEQVDAGLALYRDTATRVGRLLEPRERAIVEAVTARITSHLGS